MEKEFECDYCGTLFKNKTNLCTHVKHRCKMNPNVIMKKKITIKEKRNQTEVINEDNYIQLLSLITNQNLLISELRKDVDKLKKKLQGNIGNQNTINGNQNTTNICHNLIDNSITNNVDNRTIIYFNAKCINLYEIKKELHGKKFAQDYIYGYVKAIKKNNIYDFLKDKEIIDREKVVFPVKLVACRNDVMHVEMNVGPDYIIKDDVKNKIIKDDENNKIIKDDGTEFNKIAKDIIINSVLKADNEAIEDYFKNDSGFEYVHPCFDDKNNHATHHFIEKLKKLEPTANYSIASIYGQ